jgi:hypothetical protein
MTIYKLKIKVLTKPLAYVKNQDQPITKRK